MWVIMRHWNQRFKQVCFRIGLYDYIFANDSIRDDLDLSDFDDEILQPHVVCREPDGDYVDEDDETESDASFESESLGFDRESNISSISMTASSRCVKIPVDLDDNVDHMLVDDPSHEDTSQSDHDMEHGRLLTHNEHRQMESGLWAETTTDCFTQGRPGQVIHVEDSDAYEHDVQNFDVCDPDNVWAPFRSKMDWSVAKWAKLRGPSSTAVTELLSIEGVCSDICGSLLFPNFTTDSYLTLLDCLTRIRMT